jgi:hypothetical protein
MFGPGQSEGESERAAEAATETETGTEKGEKPLSNKAAMINNSAHSRAANKLWAIEDNEHLPTPDHCKAIPEKTPNICPLQTTARLSPPPPSATNICPLQTTARLSPPPPSATKHRRAHFCHY